MCERCRAIDTEAFKQACERHYQQTLDDIYLRYHIYTNKLRGIHQVQPADDWASAFESLAERLAAEVEAR